MNKILKLSAIALLASSTSLMAQSKSFQGASIAAFGSIVGVEATGNVTDANSDTNSGKIGQITPIAGIDVAYTFAAGSNGFVGVGATYIPAEADFATGNTNASTGNTASNVRGKIKDPYSIYIQPGYAINNSSAVYGKISYLQADFNVTSNNTITQQPGDLNGWGYAIGLKTFLTQNTFIQAEASYAEYDSLTAKYTSSESSTINTVSAKPKVAAGTISIGYKF
jgi:hypothetical protein